ncbi:MAG TPA: NADH-quinone oxidoreductase subunit C [Steroidobacteraceae bacterium]|nr:NADH-quinone oxidoreductase subunit C [Steroidobacteraceae bacterium]
MELQNWIDQSTPLPGAPGLRQLDVTPDTWRACSMDVAASGGRLFSLWADCAGEVTVFAALVAEPVVLLLVLELPAASTYPSLADIFPAAARMERAVADLCGVSARDTDTRPWLRHVAWPANYFPLAGRSPSGVSNQSLIDDYPFVRVAGDGVHEIAVGPVHAGIIEPGHFRFSVVGEKVLRLEERLGYTHKGVEQRFTQLQLPDGHRLAARVSGDSAVAYSWAYCQALEGMAQTSIPARAAFLRALALECERIANHLGDLGALGNDAGFAFGLAQFSRLKESWLRANESAFGQRYLMDFIVPGGTQGDPPATALAGLVDCAGMIAGKAALFRTIYDEHAGVRDRFAGAGIVSPQLAAQLGLTGFAGRASGQAHDLRIDLPCEPYARLAVRKMTSTEGDVFARVAVRFDELQESLRLVEQIVRQLPDDGHRTIVATPPDGSLGIGLIEGWRGPVMMALTAGPAGQIRRCHPHDPSWQNWPVLEHAVIGNIVPDFPLINKSFNLSYSGHDL